MPSACIFVRCLCTEVPPIRKANGVGLGCWGCSGRPFGGRRQHPAANHSTPYAGAHNIARQKASSQGRAPPPPPPPQSRPSRQAWFFDVCEVRFSFCFSFYRFYPWPAFGTSFTASHGSLTAPLKASFRRREPRCWPFSAGSSPPPSTIPLPLSIRSTLRSPSLAPPTRGLFPSIDAALCGEEVREVKGCLLSFLL